MEVRSNKPRGNTSAGGGGISNGELPEHQPLPRKERERERHRQEIMEAAEKLLARKSYPELSVQEIADEAEFSVGFLYKIFRSKEEIFGSVIRNKQDALMDLMDDRLAGEGGVEERLRSFIQGVFSWLNENPAYTASSHRELLAIGTMLPGLAAEYNMVQARYVTKMKDFFSEGIGEGVWEGEEPELMARTLKVLMKGFVQEDLCLGREQKDWTEYTAVIMRIFMRAFGSEGGRKRYDV